MNQSIALDPPAAGAAGTTFNLKPLLAANLACTMAMMAFVAIVGPLARQLLLPAWQAGAAVTVGGVLWMLLSRPWGAASGRRGRRAILLTGVGGFALSYWAMCAVLVMSLQFMPSALLVFVGLLLTRGAIGAFCAAIPSTGQALIADFIPPDRRAGVMASLGAANAVGMALGPALAAALAQYSLSLPLYVTALLPPMAWVVLWRALPRHEHHAAASPSTLQLNDARLRRPMAVAFIAMFCVAVAQITVGFFAIDRLHLGPGAAARAAGIALTAVGIGLIASQLVVRRLDWPPLRLIRTMDRLVDWYGAPLSIRMDNGPEMTSHDFVEWAQRTGIALNYIEPGEPNQNAYIERFNRTFRTEVLYAYLFNSIEQVQAIADDWLTQYNEYRPHDALGGVPPKQFMPRLINTTAADSRNQLSA